MLEPKSDFSSYDQFDWAIEFEVEIRFLIELLSHVFGKKPEQIIEVLCRHEADLPRLRYEATDIDDSHDPQWIRSRYTTVLHTKVLLSNVLESSDWGPVPNNSLVCREEIKYKGASCPDAETLEVIFESSATSGKVSELVRTVAPDQPIRLESCWAPRYEFESFLEQIPILSNWTEKLSEHTTTTDQRSGATDEPPRWLWTRTGGNRWRCGPELNPLIIEPITACTDLHYAISHEGEDCSYASYESENRPDKDQQAARVLEQSSSLNEMEPEELRRLKAGIENLKNEIEIAKETGDIDKEAELEEQLMQVIEWRDSGTKPGGQSRPMSAGDPNIKSAKAMRERKRLLLSKLREADLSQMADHIERYFKMRNRSFSYNRGHPYPVWTIR